GATFGLATFNYARVLGRMLLRGRAGYVGITGMEVVGDLLVEMAAGDVDAARMRGPGRVAIRVRAAAVAADGAVVGGLFTVQGLQEPIPSVDETGLEDPGSGRVPAASMTSLR